MRPVRDIEDAVQALEATLTRQLLSASKAFGGGDTPGSQIRSDMFVETLADAIAQAGGLGLAPMLRDALGGTGAEADSAFEPPRALSSFLGLPNRASTTGASSESSALVSSEFGRRIDPLEGDTRFHTGIDLAVPEGTPVKAAMDGVVKTAGPRGGYGKAVEIDHGNGLTTLYAHNSELAVMPGERVVAGQVIAAAGQTGRATGAHLHLEVRVEGKPTNPRSALNAYRIRVEDTVAAHSPLSPRKGDTP